MDPLLATLSDAELAARSQAGSPDAFEVLVSRYEAALFRFIRAKAYRTPDAEDLLQEVFLRAWTKIHHFSPRYPFSSWLFTLARNQTASFYRRPGLPLREDPEEAPDPPDPRQNPQEKYEARDHHLHFWQGIRDALTPEQFDALWFFYQEDMSIKDMAETLGKSQVSCRVLLHRARKQLASSLDPTLRDYTPNGSIPSPYPNGFHPS